MSYENVLVLCPSRMGEPSPLALRLQSLGATLIVEPGRSDIAQARSVLLGRAQSYIGQCGDGMWLFWSDDDVGAADEVEAFDAMLDTAKQFRRGSRCIAISGRYVSRVQPWAIAGRATKMGALHTSAGQDSQVLIRGGFGMGAFLCLWSDVMRVIESVPLIRPRRGVAYPAAFATGPMLDENDQWCWASEDFMHCMYLEKAAVPVVLAKQCFVHGGRHVTASTVLYGPDGEEVEL